MNLFILLNENTKIFFWFEIFIIFDVSNNMLFFIINFDIQIFILIENADKAVNIYMFMQSLNMAINITIEEIVFQNIINYKIRKLKLFKSII